MSKVFLEAIKGTNDNYDKIIIDRDGKVDIEYLRNGVITKEIHNISFANELENELKEAFDIMKLVYDKEKQPNFKITFNNYEFMSFDLYIDIKLMVRNNQFKKLSIYDRYKNEKKELESKKEIEKTIEILDKYEKEKNIIDISNVEDSKYEEKRNIIQFELKNNSNFELGESRFFANTIDISEDVEIPEFLEFVGQLNLKDISKYDSKNLLPKEGMLYFFQSPALLEDHFYENGKVIYSNNLNLKRKNIKTIGSEDDSCPNYSIFNISNSIENFNDRYIKTDDKLEYDSFKGETLNKIYGFYTDCQMNEINIIKVSKKYIVLLQLGTDIYGEGVTTFLISEEDLKKQNFNNIIYTYVQS